MKNLNTSFLFFVLYVFCKFGANSLYAQVVIDSSTYYSNLIQTSKDNEDLVKAFRYFQEQKNKDFKRDYIIGAVYDLTQMAFAERKMGFLNASENTAVDGLKLLDELGGDETVNIYKISLYNHLGILYKELEDYKNALYYYNKVNQLINSSMSKVTLFNNIGNVYKGQGNLEKAIAFYKKSYDVSLKYNNKRITSRALDNLGLAQTKLKKPEGFKNLINALGLRIEEEDVEGVFTSYMHLVEYYIDEKEKKNALSYAEKAFELAEQTKNVKYIDNALAIKMRLKKDPEVLAFITLNDSISEAKRVANKKYTAIKYNYSKKERELLESELEKERNQMYSISILIFLLAVGTSIYFYLKSRHKKDTLQQIYKTEVQISKRVHDEVANDVYHFMTKFQASPTINEAFLDDLEAIYDKTRDISKQNSEIDVNEAFSELLSDLLLSFHSDIVNVVAKGLSKVKWDAFSKEKKVTIYRVLQELMVNMKKHSQASIVVVSFDNSTNKLVIDYKDNGIGGDLKSRNGLLNVENRIHSINGKIKFDSIINEGFRAQIRV